MSAVQLLQKILQTSAVPNGLACSPTAIRKELDGTALVGELYSGAVSVGYLIAPALKLCNRMGYALRLKPCLSLCVKSCHSYRYLSSRSRSALSSQASRYAL